MMTMKQLLQSQIIKKETTSKPVISQHLDLERSLLDGSPVLRHRTRDRERNRQRSDPANRSMDTTKEEEKVDDEQQQQQQQQTVVTKIPKGKSCKGYLYYSSSLKSHDRNPRCIGIPRALPQVPDFVVRHSEFKASKEGRTLIHFYYACLGYSVYNNVNGVSSDKLTNVNDVSTDKRVTRQLPLCTGLELLLDKPAPAPASAPTTPVPAPARNREGIHELPQSRVHNKPARRSRENFLNRFTRNANLVASGVARNMRRVGNYLKESVEDIMYPHRKRRK